MPCSDGGPTPQEMADRRMVPAMLCALVSLLEREHYLSAYLDKIDWREAGVSRAWFDSWWAQHRREDARRRREEREARERKAQRAAALAKLTPEERAALGD